jgi:hypothetical protein
MSIVNVGGSHGSRASVTLSLDDTLECHVFGITDEIAARVMLDDTQTGVGRRKSSGDESTEHAAIPVIVPASFIRAALSPVELRVEVANATVHHARAGAEQSLAWREVARITVHPALGQQLSVAVASLPFALGAWTAVEALAERTMTSRGRMALDVAVALGCVAPMAAALRARLAGVSRWRTIALWSLVTLLLALPTTLLTELVDNRSGAELTVQERIRIPPGVSRWLPAELDDHRVALESRGLILEEDGVLGPCMPSPSADRGPSWLPLRRLRLYRRQSLHAMARGVLSSIGVDERAACDARASSPSVCCVPISSNVAAEADPRAIRSPGMQPGVTRTVRVRPESDAALSFEPRYLGAATVRVLAWHGLALRGAQRNTGVVHMSWTASAPLRTLLIDGFSNDADRHFDVTLERGTALRVTCPSTTDTVHLVIAPSDAIASLGMAGVQYPLATDQPTVLCSTPSGQAKVELRRGAELSLPSPWPLPFNTTSVEVIERGGERNISVGTAYCPERVGSHFSLVSVDAPAYPSIRTLYHFSEESIGKTLWVSDRRDDNRVFLCVPSARSAVPSDDTARTPQVDPLLRSPHVTIIPWMSDTPVHAALERRDRWRLTPSSEFPRVQCCTLFESNEVRRCPALAPGDRLVRRNNLSHPQCSAVFRVEYAVKPTPRDTRTQRREPHWRWGF